jgi:hypothetical protein
LINRQHHTLPFVPSHRGRRDREDDRAQERVDKENKKNGNTLAVLNGWLRPWGSLSKQNNEEATPPWLALGHG